MNTDQLNARLAALSPAKRALLEQRLRQSAVRTPPFLGIARRAERATAPLSFAQQRLWFLSQLEPESSSYNESGAVRLSGPLNVEGLQAAIDQLVARHEILRTTIGTVDGEPRQMIKAHARVELPLVVLRDTSPEHQDSALENVLFEAMRRPFNLSRDLPVRFLLVRLAEHEHVLLKVIHHIASDGWSTGIVWRELAKFYRDYLSGVVTVLPELSIQYQDYADWQRAWLQGEVLEEQIGYWKNRLQGSEPLNLPTDRPRAAGKKSAAARAVLDLDGVITNSLKAFSRQHGVTFFMTLLAAFQTLLQRYCGQNDTVVGSPIAGRTRPQLEDLIGFFVNTLVLRLDLSRDPTFLQVLHQARDAALGAYAHQELPFERIVEELNPVRDLDALPLFNVMFAHQSVPQVAVEFAGLEISAVDVPSLEAKFDLFFAVSERNGQLRLRMDYAADLFDAATIERMLANFQTLLSSIVDHPERRISELDLITPVEKQKLLVEWNATKQDYRRDKCVHELFETQAESTPDAVALIFKDEQLTYGALNTRANQLARYLKQHGVKSRDPVALCMERSIDVVIGLLAILKAGGVYLPLDPHYPGERLAYMLEDAGARVLLTQQALVERGRWEMEDRDGRCTVICLDRDGSAIEIEPEGNLNCPAAADDLAYIIYTSGSTGVPKGVLGHHRGLVNRFHWMWERYPFEAGEVCCQKTSLSFVDSLWELLGPLLRGVPTVIVPEAQAKDPGELVTTLARREVSRIVLVPSLLRAMLALRPALQEVLPKLRFWVSSGEALNRELVQTFRRCLPASRLINLYGSSEVAADVTYWEVVGHEDDSSPVLIGRPIANTQAYVLDEHLNPVPVGVPGVLYIGGDGLARGYLNQVELTAERFVVHSFDGASARRLYKTGDRARYRPDGNLEFLGRSDNQVKVRGHRIELGEIEAALALHPDVRQSAVTAHARGASAETDIIAYVVPASAAAASGIELRRFLQQKLPEYMLPASYVLLEALPMTASGKVDRQQLPNMQTVLECPEPEVVEPRDHVERRLCELFAGLLSLDKVRPGDNFFEIGGHSLLGVRLMNQIEKEFGKSMPIAALFSAPSVEQLATLLRKGDTESLWTSMLPIQTEGAKRPFFWVHGQVSNAFLPRYLGKDQPIYGFRHQGHDGYPAKESSVFGIAKLYLAELRSVQPHGPYVIGGYCFGGLVAFEMAQQLNRVAEEVALLVLLDPPNPGSRDVRLAVDMVPNERSPTPMLHAELQRHLQELGKRRVFAEQFQYIKVRAVAKIVGMASALLGPVQNRFQRHVYQACLFFGWRLPASVRSRYMLDLYMKAIRGYKAASYDGDAIMFVSGSNAKREQTWRDLLHERLRVFEVSGRHEGLLTEPYLQEWVEELRQRLALLR